MTMPEMTMKEMQQKGLETPSEAVYLDCVTDSGDAAFIARLCRYPRPGFAWVWGHLFVDNHVYAFTDHELPCDDLETNLDQDPTAYQLSWPNGVVAMHRSGPRHSPLACNLEGRFMVRDSAHPAHGDGPLECQVSATFRASSGAISNRAGRSEVLGTASITARLGDREFSFNGRSQFHEQVQTDPRFTAPFSYLTLRGADLGVIAIRGSRGARGHLLGRNEVIEIDRIELTPPGSVRELGLHGRDGSFFAGGRLRTTYDYSVPVFDGYRPGTLVTGELAGATVSGCINDFLLDRLHFDRSPISGAV